ncbi:MAG: flagellar biosynthetic protein FliO [Pontiellaceae bacterium]|nr:flagellar biosynthetic protein FliO [Pontiellaceae bacterium]
MNSGSTGFEVFRMLFSLVLVLGGMVGAYVWLKRRGGVMPGSSERRMRVVERLSLDTRRSILLVKIDDEEILVGVGNDTVTPIKTLKPRSDDEA